MAQEMLYQVIAKRDSATGSPVLGDCMLHTGYGSVELKFGASQPDVPETVANALKANNDVMVIPSGQLGDAPSPIEMPADTAAIKLAEAQRKLEAVEAALLVANGQAGQAEGDGTIRLQGPDGEVVVLTQAQLAAIAMQHLASKNDAATEAKLAAAREHLSQEGETVPDVGDGVKTGGVEPADGGTPVVIPRGFDAKLPDGQDRCLAAKADKTQCKNPASAGSACALDAHQAQLKDRAAPAGA